LGMFQFGRRHRFRGGQSGPGRLPEERAIVGSGRYLDISPVETPAVTGPPYRLGRPPGAKCCFGPGPWARCGNHMFELSLQWVPGHRPAPA
jgi:hypothetical protein